MKIGIDIVEIERFEKMSDDRAKLEKIFSKKEINYAESFNKACEHFAGMFCAKEAFFKALGCGIKKLTDIINVEVLHEKTGKPYLLFKGKRMGELSISHTDKMSEAIVLLTEEEYESFWN